MSKVSIEERLDRLESLDAIRQLPARYALCLDMRDMNAMVSLFTPDVRVGREQSGRLSWQPGRACDEPYRLAPPANARWGSHHAAAQGRLGEQPTRRLRVITAAHPTDEKVAQLSRGPSAKDRVGDRCASRLMTVAVSENDGPPRHAAPPGLAARGRWCHPRRGPQLGPSLGREICEDRTPHVHTSTY